MEVFVPSARTKKDGYRKVISGSGWAWVRVRGGRDSLGYRRGRGLSRRLVNGFTFWEYIWF